MRRVGLCTRFAASSLGANALLISIFGTVLHFCSLGYPLGAKIITFIFFGIFIFSFLLIKLMVTCVQLYVFLVLNQLFMIQTIRAGL